VGLGIGAGGGRRGLSPVWLNAPMRRDWIPAGARTTQGFTWIEVLIVLVVLSVLALMAIPSMTEATVRRQVKDAMALADIAKAGVQVAYTLAGDLPADNKAAGLPDADKIVSVLVQSVTVKQGAITLEFGNNAHKALAGKHLTLRPAIVPGEARVPISWLCHNVAVPNNMQARGIDETDVRADMLPVECRGPGA
jgi:type IV pilus assembly protein PilA